MCVGGWVCVCVMIYNTSVCDITYDSAGICLKEIVLFEIYACFKL